MKNKLLHIFLILISGILMISCSKESPTVNPADLIRSYFPNSPGTPLIMQSSYTYPAGGDIDIPVNANIVLVFSKEVRITGTPTANTNVTSNILINGGILYTHNTSLNTVTITPNSSFGYSSINSVAVSTSFQDTDGQPLNTAVSYTFQAVASDSPVTAPIVLTAMRYPAAGATGVSRYLSYVEVTFSKPVTNVTTATFTITPAVAGVTVTNPYGNTYRLNMGAALNYYTPPPVVGFNYTINLTGAIVDTALPSPNALTPHSWTFRTEADPASSPASISNVAVLSTTNTTAVIAFNTDAPALRANTYLQYGTTPALGTDSPHENTWDWDGCGDTKHTNHGFNLNPPLVHNTKYYFRACVDVAGTCDVASPVYSFYTKTDTAAGGGAKVLTNAANNQNEIAAVQMDDGSSYVFWVDANSSKIFGQFFAADGSEQWVAGVGTALTDNGSYTNITAIKSRYSSNNEVILLYRNGNSIYAKMLYNNAGTPAFVWGAPADTAAGTGINLLANAPANDSFAGSNFTVALAHEKPLIKATGVADIPPGDVVSLMYDKNRDFSTLGLTTLFNIIYDTGTWQRARTEVTNSFDVFKFSLRSTNTPTFSLNTSYPYYIANNTWAGFTVATVIDATNFTTNGAVSGYSIGDILRNTVTTTWTVITNIAGVGPYTVTTDKNHDFTLAGDTFRIYPRIAGPLTSQAVTNPLWDEVPSALFNPGVNVLANDVVFNNSAFTKAQVAAIDLARDTNYALRLSTNIMSNGNSYTIAGPPAGATYIISGFSTSFANNFTLDDSGANFTVAGVVQGDIVYNVNDDISAEVLTVAATQLTLTADIFNTAINKKYYIFRKRTFILTYIDTAGNVISRVFNLATAAQIGANVSVATLAVPYTNPVSVSDESGSSIVAYQDSTGIVSAASVSANATLKWGPIVKTVAGYTVNQILPDRAVDSIGGAYILLSNASTGDIKIHRINGSNGLTAGGGWPVTAPFTGYSPHAAVDRYSTTLPSRIIMTYLPTHAAGTTFRHVGLASYTGAGGAASFSGNVTLDTAAEAYNCQLPKVVVSEKNTAALDDFYIAWFDGRYYSSIGYGIFAQRYNSAGTKYNTAPWSNVNGNELFIASPTSSGLTGELSLHLNFYDSTTPSGFIPVWLDFRNKAGTGTDIYYQGVKADGSFLP